MFNLAVILRESAAATPDKPVATWAGGRMTFAELDDLSDRLSMKRVRALMAEGLIEIAPVGFMRGRTLNNAFVVIDEAQNCTYVQLKMLLTRLGWHSTMVITGVPTQSDLLPGVSGLGDVANRLEALNDVSVVRLKDVDIVRHPLVASMLGVL